MKLTYDSLKNLLDNSQSISLSDSIPLDILIRLAKVVGKTENKHLTIRVKKLGVEDLKKISNEASQEKISFYVDDIQDK